MAEKPVKENLPADLPTDWVLEQVVTPGGTEAGLSPQHGYNYLMAKVNEAILAINDLNNGFENVGGGFIEMQTSLPIGDREDETLYGLILADFST